LELGKASQRCGAFFVLNFSIVWHFDMSKWTRSYVDFFNGGFDVAKSSEKFIHLAIISGNISQMIVANQFRDSSVYFW